MKLMFIHPFFNVYGGAEKVVLDLYRLCAKDYKTEIYTLFDVEKIRNLNNVHGKFVDNPKLFSLFGYKINPFINNYIKKLGKILALNYELGDKIILSNFPASLIVYEACKTNKNIKKSDIYWLCFEPDKILYYEGYRKLGYMPSDVENWKYSFATKFLSKWREKDKSIIKESKIMCFSKYMEKLVKKLYGNVNSKVDLKLYVDTKDWVVLDKKSAITKLNKKLNLNLNQDDFIILAISRLEYSKGLHEMMGVLSELRKQKKFTCLIAGQGELYNYLKKESIKHDDIKLLGFVPNDLLSSLYFASNVFMFLGTHEPSGPLTVLEAMYSNCVTITSNEGGSAEKIEDKKDGFLVDANNTKEIAELLCSIYEMDTSEILDRAKKKISDEHSLKNFYNDFRKSLDIN